MQPVRITRQPTDRRGIVLILALGMLTLFTIVAITLASISRTQATAAGNFKRLEQYGSNALTVRDAQVNDLFRYALNQLVYDTRNRQSAIRGHSLLRDMYGSPTKYSLTLDPGDSTKIQAISGIAGDGAELRLKHNDLRKLLNISLTNNNDPRLMALDYQKVYNGTGLFAPRKIDFTGATFTAATGGMTAGSISGFENLYLKNPEIAAQVAFMNIPGKLMPRTPTNYPNSPADWLQILLNPSNTPNTASYWRPLFPINYTEFDVFTPTTGAVTRAATVGSIDPERFTYVDGTGAWGALAGDHWFGADEDYDYPDINNMFLAMERADGKMLIPSFHRPGIIAQVADGVNSLTSYGYVNTNPVQREMIGKLPWLPYDSTKTAGVLPNPPADFRGLVLRPRAADRDAATLGVSSPRAGKFREMADAYVGAVANNVPGQDGLPDDLDGSGFIGDHPSELDVDTDGDGLNDSIWVDLGHPVIQVGDSAVKPLFAFKVIGMDGKINLNVHGNLYKSPTLLAANKAYNWAPVPNAPDTQSINYTVMHKSNLGASPTEINPQYAFILGDNPGVFSSYAIGSAYPPVPIWGLPAGMSGYFDPYLRLLEGYTNLYTGDQAAGRWTGRAGAPSLPGLASSDDNGNLTNPTYPNPDLSSSQPSIANQENFDTSIGGVAILTNNYDYSSGNGASPIPTLPIAVGATSMPAGTPAVHGLFSPVDFFGVGSKYSPLSHTAQSTTNSTSMGLLPAGEGSLVNGYLNYAEITGGTFGAKLKSLDDGGSLVTPPTKPLSSSEIPSKGLVVDRLLANEATETNIFNPIDDSLFTADEIAALLRASDFDGSVNQSRLLNLLPDQVAKRAVNVAAGELGDIQSQTPTYFSSESYGKRRMQNLFTHESWDLIRFNAPPFLHSSSAATGSGFGLYLGPALPGSGAELLELFGDNLVGYGNNNPVESYIARSHSGEAGPNFITQLINYQLPNNSTGTISPTSTSPYVALRDAYEQLALTQTKDGKDFLVPYEIQMGRRLDLNRPLTAYTMNGVPGARSPKEVDDERSSYAQQLYVLLSLASGACGADAGSSSQLMSPQARLAQSRVLAQIAVNIVDYMDPDSVMTFMQFDPDLSDGWDDPATTTKPLIDSAGANNIAPNSPEFNSITTVMGFEMPQLVINESMAVVAEDNSNSSDPMNPIRDEYLFTWIELFNPWPDAIDPIDNVQGTALALNGQPVFMLQVNRLNTSSPDGMDSPPLPPISVSDLPANITSLNQLILFNGTAVPNSPVLKGTTSSGSDGGPSSGVSSVRVAGRNGAGTGSGNAPGYFVVGPMNITSTLIKNNLVNVLNAFPPGVKNDYTAAACAFKWEDTKDAPLEPQVDIRLYRLRNPFIPFDPTSNTNNPFVAIDSVSHQPQNTPSVRPFEQRLVDTMNSNSAQTQTPSPPISTQKSGLYCIQDISVASVQPAWVSTAASLAVAPFHSWQRRQPWHGYNSNWRPYLINGTPGHPFMGTFLNLPMAGSPLPPSMNVQQNLEGAFLGLPSLTNPVRYYASVATAPTAVPGTTSYSNLNADNAMRQNGFSPSAPMFGQPNGNAYRRWEAFPFLNRQLATPLELLPLRLYGSHLCFLMGGNIPTVPPGLVNKPTEWRLRFTDDCEFFPHPWRLDPSVMPAGGGGDFYERLWRTRQVPWYQDSRVTHPTFPSLAWTTTTDIANASSVPNLLALNPPLSMPANPPEVQLPLPHLYRFFEFVECRSRMNNGILASQQWANISPGTGWPDHMLPGSRGPLFPARGTGLVSPVTLPNSLPTSVLATQRLERTPGKINLNLIADEEVYRALLDSVETAYFNLTIDYVVNQAAYAAGDDYVDLVSRNYWPQNYWFAPPAISAGAGSLFSPLGQAPLGDPGIIGGTTKVLDVIDVMGRMVPWSSLTLNNTTSSTVVTPPLANAPIVSVLSTGGFDIGASRLFGSPILISSLGMTGTVSNNLANPLATNPNVVGSPNLQFPGIVNGPNPLATSSPGIATLFPGTDPNRQVHSEMYRAFLLSRSGPDGIHGTADDKPFRSFAADDVSDTILRIRNSATNGLVKEGSVNWNGTSLVSPTIAEGQAIVARTYLDGSDDYVSMVTPAMSFYVGPYITRLGGQRVPGLFDPISDPFSDFVLPVGNGAPVVYASIPHLWPIGADPGAASPTVAVDFQSRLPTDNAGKLDSMSLSPKLPADYWALEERRIELLAKISGNVTTRSHVFAAWVTVGFFRVEPGTEGLKVPLLGAEVGSESGKTFRHRAFFIIDRSQAKSYDPEDIDANFDLDVMRQKKLLEYYKFIE